jgi:methylenetetrahydrofolate--tRNA-(uracil-5-)-methyltransferase
LASHASPRNNLQAVSLFHSEVYANGTPMTKPIHIIGAGMAGSEAAWQVAQAGVPVVLHEMRPKVGTDAHKTGGFAELVCSNSFRSDDADQNAVGLLHWEMRAAGSVIMATADRHQVPAGGALAVDREAFSAEVTETLKAHPLVSVEYDEIAGLPPEDWDSVIVATGPLTSPALSKAIGQITGEADLAFFDAIAPIIHRETIDMDKAWFQSRYDKVGPGGTGKDYINCPMDRAQYEAFVQALLDGVKTDFKEWEKSTPYFSGCLPIEVMAESGPETLRHGPMKPRGLTNAHQPEVKAYAVVQLRQDNKLGTLYNMVGFQTKLKYADQVQVFKTIPGLENAEFARLGGLHRNTFLNSPKVLDERLRLKACSRLRFAGQITGVEGYVESAAMGLMAGRMAAAERRGEPFAVPPATTAHGALINHITGGHIETTDKGTGSFQPMNVNFGLFPPVDAPKRVEGKRLDHTEKAAARKRAYTSRAKADFAAWLGGAVAIAAE